MTAGPRARLFGVHNIFQDLGTLMRALAKVAREQRRLQRRIRGVERHLEALDENVKALLRLSMSDHDLPYPERLLHRRFRLHSQNAEDGLTLALLDQIGVTKRRFVELGCGDNGGNSGILALELGWAGVFVDASADRLAILRARLPAGRVRVIQDWLTAERVDDIVAAGGLSGEIDVLGIDVDGNDYWLWEALTVVSPRLVIIEYNAIYGPDRAVVVPYDPDFERRAVDEMNGLYYGASLRALVELARRKGYGLVAVEPSGVNAYFVRADVSTEIPAVDPRSEFRMQARYAVLIRDGFDIWHETSARGLPLLDLETS